MAFLRLTISQLILYDAHQIKLSANKNSSLQATTYLPINPTKNVCITLYCVINGILLIFNIFNKLKKGLRVRCRLSGITN